MADTAASRIRASVAALPEELRVPWGAHGRYVNASGGLAVVDPAPMPNLAPQVDIAAHIALLASPDVAIALADLLDAIWHHEEFAADFDAITEARAALEAAITKGADRGE